MQFFNETIPYRKNANGLIEGVCFLDEKEASLDQLGEFLLQAMNDNEKTLCNLGEKLNGFFMSAYQKGDEAVVITDRVRSYPVFYGAAFDHIYISDKPEWIKEKIGNVTWNFEGEKELTLLGYTTGNETLYKEIKQLQAGELLYIKQNNISKKRYHKIKYASLTLDIQSWKNIHEQVLEKAMRRMLQYAGNHTLVVPLSGGYDSRWIVLMLKKLNVKDVITFTYGNEDDIDVKISKRLAKKLKFKWYFLEYSLQDYEEMYASYEYEQYLHFSGKYSSLPHAQDWIAVKKLKDKQLIPDNSIFVPGHLGDVLSGECSDIKEYLYRRKRRLREGAKALVDYLYTSKLLSIKEKAYYVRKVSEDMKQYQCESDDGTILYELWWSRQRTSKYIINSVRVYEFWGYQWWLPMCDESYWEFWSRVPGKLKIKQKLYTIHMKHMMKEILGEIIPRDTEYDHQRRTLKHWLASTLSVNLKNYLKYIGQGAHKGYQPALKDCQQRMFHEVKDYVEDEVIVSFNYLLALYYLKLLK